MQCNSVSITYLWLFNLNYCGHKVYYQPLFTLSLDHIEYQTETRCLMSCCTNLSAEPNLLRTLQRLVQKRNFGENQIALSHAAGFHLLPSPVKTAHLLFMQQLTPSLKSCYIRWINKLFLKIFCEHLPRLKFLRLSQPSVNWRLRRNSMTEWIHFVWVCPHISWWLFGSWHKIAICWWVRELGVVSVDTSRVPHTSQLVPPSLLCSFVFTCTYHKWLHIRVGGEHATVSFMRLTLFLDLHTMLFLCPL